MTGIENTQMQKREIYTVLESTWKRMALDRYRKYSDADGNQKRGRQTSCKTGMKS